MKNKSLKGILALGILMLMQTGCNPQGNTTEKKEKYNQVIALQNRANLLRHEGDIDSAISYYKKGIKNCYALIKAGDSIKDTIYIQKISRLYHDIGFIFDSLKNHDTALVYLRESLKWAKLSKAETMILGDEYLIGYIYFTNGKNYQEGSSEQKTLYLNGVNYLTLAVRAMDSLGLSQKKRDQNKVRLGAYGLNSIMYKELGDSNHAAFYRNKYKELKAQLNTETNQ